MATSHSCESPLSPIISADIYSNRSHSNHNNYGLRMDLALNTVSDKIPDTTKPVTPRNIYKDYENSPLTDSDIDQLGFEMSQELMSLIDSSMIEGGHEEKRLSISIKHRM